VSVDYLRDLSAISRRHDLPFVIHVRETKLQRVLGAEKYGKSLVKYIHDLYLLDERVQVVHGIWTDRDDMAILAAAGAIGAYNQVCNLRLGSGVMPFCQLRDQGGALCLGTDEAIADDSCNLWNTAKLAGMIHTLHDPDYLS